jgi:AraC-like DNA-binding protein
VVKRACTSFETTDPEEFVERLRPVLPSGYSLSPLTRAFEGRAVHARLGAVGFFQARVTSSRAIRVDESSFHGMNFPLNHPLALEHPASRPLPATESAIWHSGCDDFELRIPGGSLLVLTIGDRRLREVAERVAPGAEVSRGAAAIHLGHGPGRRLWRLADRGWSLLCRASSSPWSELEATELSSELESAFVQAIVGTSPTASALDGNGLLDAEEWADARLQEPITVAEMATVAGVSAPTLWRSFQRRHGFGPKTWLQRRRLDAARRRLLGSGPDETSVSRVALGLGFSHLSRFARDYQREFDELPSETLRR